jgi:hypothetical protein
MMLSSHAHPFTHSLASPTTPCAPGTIVLVQTFALESRYCASGYVALTGKYSSTCSPTAAPTGAPTAPTASPTSFPTTAAPTLAAGASSGGGGGGGGAAAGAAVAVVVIVIAILAVVWYRRKLKQANNSQKIPHWSDNPSFNGPSGPAVRGELAGTDAPNYEDISNYENTELMVDHIRKWSTVLMRGNVVLSERLGSGEFGEVFGGTVDIDGEKTPCACKTLRPRHTFTEKREFLAEAGIMAQFHHRNVVSLLGVILEGEPIVIVIELMKEGDLIRHLLSHREDKSLTVEKKIRWGLDVAEGMS